MTKIIKYTNKDNETLYKFRYYAGLDETTGKQRYIRRQGFTSEKDAKTELLKIEYLVSTNQYFKSVKSGKFVDVLDEWLSLHKETVKPSTLVRENSYITNHIKPYFKNMYVDKITLRQCQNFTNKAFAAAPAAYTQIIGIVKSILDYALRLDMIKSNPILYVIKPKRQATISDKHNNYYNKQELKKFLDVAKDTSLKKYALFRLGINSMNKHQLIFSNGNNEYIYSGTVRKSIKILAKKAGIHSITTHGFRHTHATLLFASGMDIKQVQARLGHSNVQTTLNIYTHAIQDKQDKIGDEFAKYINFS